MAAAYGADKHTGRRCRPVYQKHYAAAAATGERPVISPAAILAALMLAALTGLLLYRRLRTRDAERKRTSFEDALKLLAPSDDPAATGLVTLADLPDDQAADVVALDPACQGFSRRRLMDLGFTPGARLEPALQTFAGDPRAYRVRGTLIALRQDQARQVLVRPAREADAPVREQIR